MANEKLQPYQAFWDKANKKGTPEQIERFLSILDNRKELLCGNNKEAQKEFDALHSSVEKKLKFLKNDKLQVYRVAWDSIKEEGSLEEIKKFLDILASKKEELCGSDKDLEKSFDFLQDSGKRKLNILEKDKTTKIHLLKFLDVKADESETSKEINDRFADNVNLNNIKEKWNETHNSLSNDELDKFLDAMIYNEDELCQEEESSSFNIFSQPESKFNQYQEITQQALAQRIDQLENLKDAKDFYKKYAYDISYENLYRFKNKLDDPKTKTDWCRDNKATQKEFDTFNQEMNPLIERMGRTISRLGSFVLEKVDDKIGDQVRSLAKMAGKVVRVIAVIAIVAVALSFLFFPPAMIGLALLFVGKLAASSLLTAMHAGAALSAVKGAGATALGAIEGAGLTAFGALQMAGATALGAAQSFWGMVAIEAAATLGLPGLVSAGLHTALPSKPQSSTETDQAMSEPVDNEASKDKSLESTPNSSPM